MNVIQLVSNKVWGGGEAYALGLCKALKADGHGVTACVRRPDPVGAVFEKAGLAVEKLRLGGVLDVFSPIRLRKILDRTEGRTIIHAHNFKDARTATAARKLCRRPDDVRIVVTRHLVKPGKPTASAESLYSEIDAIIFVSDLARRVFLEGKPKVDTAKLRTVHNSIPDSGRRDAPHGKIPTIIYAGCIAGEKGIDVLLEAAALLPPHPFRLKICGTGRTKDVMPLIERAKRLGLEDRVLWAGHINDIAFEMAASDVLVLPSKVREGCPPVILEAMAQGLPVVAADNGGQAEIVEDGVTGYLVEPGNPTALAQAITRLLNDPSLCRAMGEAGRKRYEDEFSYRNFYNRIREVYDGLF